MDRGIFDASYDLEIEVDISKLDGMDIELDSWNCSVIFNWIIGYATNYRTKYGTGIYRTSLMIGNSPMVLLVHHFDEGFYDSVNANLGMLPPQLRLEENLVMKGSMTEHDQFVLFIVVMICFQKVETFRKNIDQGYRCSFFCQ